MADPAPAVAAQAPAAAPAPVVDTAILQQQAQAAERQRVNGILNHTEAKGREKQANYLAFETGMSVEEAGKHLAMSERKAEAAALAPPAPPAAPAPSGLVAEMSAMKQPNLGSAPAEGAVTDRVDAAAELTFGMNKTDQEKYDEARATAKRLLGKVA